jgi:Reverse transcriptase (RNA-dependent DNA polymerase)
MRKIHEAMQEFDGKQEDAKKKSVGYQEICFHMIFDVKMEGLVRKARFVPSGHTTETLRSLTFASIVTHESVRLGFLIVAMNDLEIVAADVGNAYLNADCWEKIWFIADPEFGTKKGKVLIIQKAFYGLKSSGAAWRALFSSTLHELGYTPSKATWMCICAQ